ncbi:hypothetical protein PSPO01_02274 [Paraphaeosphaeria sporulosa]
MSSIHEETERLRHAYECPTSDQWREFVEGRQLRDEIVDMAKDIGYEGVRLEDMNDDEIGEVNKAILLPEEELRMKADSIMRYRGDGRQPENCLRVSLSSLSEVI